MSIDEKLLGAGTRNNEAEIMATVGCYLGTKN